MMAKTLSSNTTNYVKKYKSVNIHFYISSRNPKGDLHGHIWLRFIENTLSETKIRNFYP